MVSRAARASSSRSMPRVKSTLTRLTTVNLFVKCAETSSPRNAISAISSAVGAGGLTPDVFVIASLTESKLALNQRLFSSFKITGTAGRERNAINRHLRDQILARLGHADLAPGKVTLNLRH